ncbi:MAG: hypothetical protein JWO42_149, partial [Chloroflexi bacterium]|nr:hypothetical protein [Chloroflexota bacterium]
MRAHAVLRWLFFSTTLVYLFSAGSNFSSGDSFSELHVTDSLLSHGWIDVPIQKAGQLCAGWGCQGADGRFYSTHGIGYSLFLIPFYLIAKAFDAIHPVPACSSLTYCVPVHLISWNTSLLTALMVTLLCRFSLDLGYSLRRSLLVSLLYGFASLAWPYARFGFDVTLTGLLLLLAVREAWLATAGDGRNDAHGSSIAYAEDGPTVTHSVSTAVADIPRNAAQGDSTAVRHWFLAGALSALAILVRLPSIAAIAPLAVVCIIWLVRSPSVPKLRGFIGFSIPVLIAIGFSGWYNLVRFGSLLDDGHRLNAADHL